MKKIIDSNLLKISQGHFEKACKFSREYDALAQQCLNKYGRNGPDISGCVRDHFPLHEKEKLRALAKSITLESNLGHNARPKRTRRFTIVKLARLIATRDGSGFYGPQPNL